MTSKMVGFGRLLVGLVCLASFRVAVLGDIANEYLNFDEDCGIAPYNPITGNMTSPYVMNGRSIGYGEWPFVAWINNSLEGECSGVIFRSDQVITAGHCIENLIGTRERVDLDRRQIITVHVGMVESPRKRKRPDANEAIYEVRTVQIGADFPERGLANFNADFARLWLRTPIKFNNYVRPVCVPRREETVERLIRNHTGWFVGFGLLIQPAVPPCVPVRSVKGQTFEVKSGDCQAGYGLFETEWDTICVKAVDESAKSICLGDSGGPYLVLDSHKRWNLVAIAKMNYRCAWTHSAPLVSLFQSLSKIVEVMSDSYKYVDNLTGGETPIFAYFDINLGKAVVENPNFKIDCTDLDESRYITE